MKVIPRRLYEDDKPAGYLEGDQDYVLNNLEVAVKLLDRELKKQQAKRRVKCTHTSKKS